MERQLRPFAHWNAKLFAIIPLVDALIDDLRAKGSAYALHLFSSNERVAAWKSELRERNMHRDEH